MAYQSQSNGYVAYKLQSGLGDQASGSGAAILPIVGGTPGKVTKAVSASNLVRRDGMRVRGRHGSQKTSGAYSSELMVGAFDEVMAAVIRGTWSAPDLGVTNATGAMSSATLSAGGNTVTFSGGSIITAGYRVGDVLRNTAGLDAADQGRNLRITGMTATTITFAETLTAVAGPVSTWSFVRPGRVLINPAPGALVRRYFTIEENEVDIDGSELFTDAVFGSMKFSMQPDGQVLFDPSWTGTGQFESKNGTGAPHFTGPTEPTEAPLSVADATVRLGSSDLVDMTAFELTVNLGLNAPVVAASKYSPDVFDGQMSIGGSLTALRSDLGRVAQFLDEDQLSLHVLAVGNEENPQSFISIYVPNFTFGGVDKSALSRQGGARTQQLAIPEDLVGIDTRGGAYDPTMIKIQVSNAA